MKPYLSIWGWLLLGIIPRNIQIKIEILLDLTDASETINQTRTRSSDFVQTGLSSHSLPYLF